jgi:Ca2+-binding RTX toxin-like protein
MLGGRGPDRIFLRFAGVAGEIVDGGPGRDLLDVQDGGAVRHGSTITIDQGDGTVVSDVPGLVAATTTSFEGAYAEFEQVMVYLGTNGPDRVGTNLADRIVVDTYGGDDLVHGSVGDDRIDVGAGHDIVRAERGHDTCLDAEVTSSCEITH